MKRETTLRVVTATTSLGHSIRSARNAEPPLGLTVGIIGKELSDHEWECLIEVIGQYLEGTLCPENHQVQKRALWAALDKSVDVLEISVRSAICLQNANIRYIGELVQKTEAEMLKIKNFGRKSLKEVREILGEINLRNGMNREEVMGWERPDQRG